MSDVYEAAIEIRTSIEYLRREVATLTRVIGGCAICIVTRDVDKLLDLMERLGLMDGPAS